MEENKNEKKPVSLSEWCKVCPRGGQLGKGRYIFGFLAGFQPKNDYGTVHVFELL